MAPIPAKAEEEASKTATSCSEAGEQASPVVSQMVNEDSGVPAPDSPTDDYVEEIQAVQDTVPPAEAIVDEDLILTEAIAGASQCCMT